MAWPSCVPCPQAATGFSPKGAVVLRHLSGFHFWTPGLRLGGEAQTEFFPSLQVLNLGSNLPLCSCAEDRAGVRGLGRAGGSQEGSGSGRRRVSCRLPLLPLSLQHTLHHHSAISATRCKSLPCSIMLNAPFSERVCCLAGEPAVGEAVEC